MDIHTRNKLIDLITMWRKKILVLAERGEKEGLRVLSECVENARALINEVKKGKK